MCHSGLVFASCISILLFNELQRKHGMGSSIIVVAYSLYCGFRLEFLESEDSINRVWLKIVYQELCSKI